jgi:Dolichyl-phosphate-mannose-protein mannosyltransferase
MNRRHLYFFYFVPELLRNRVILVLAIFLVAFGVRLLIWHDTRLEVGKVQTAVTADYQRVAELLRQGGIASFLSSSSPLSDLNTLGHPPGYSILMAGVGSVFGDSRAVIQFVQIICDALAAVMIFLIVAELLPFSAAVIAGMLAALSPQFAWNSVLLLPDSLAVLPILAAIYCLTRAARNPRFATLIIAGALIGLSCWLRANAMCLTLFLAASVLFLTRKERPWRYALAVIFGTLLIVLPLTIRNAVVLHRFIPLSLGAGQTLLEGIADYDPQSRFGIPNTDVGIMKQEAEQSGRPDYYGTLFNPDGVERERARLSRGFAVVRSHPFWFAGVMARRAASMLRLERSRLVSTETPVSHALATDNLEPVWIGTPAELFSSGVGLSPRVRVQHELSTDRLTLIGDDSKYGDQFAPNAVDVKKDFDYVFTLPVTVERGRMRISIVSPGGPTYSSTIVETIENTKPEDQPASLVQLSFVARDNQRVQVVFSNEASNPPNPVVKVGAIKLFELGPSRFLWTRYPRLLVHYLQKIFLTAVMLPLAIIGLALLIVKKNSRALIILLVVPAYFFCVQSIVHTEYRYVLAVDYFIFALVGVAVAWSADILSARARSARK